MIKYLIIIPILTLLTACAGNWVVNIDSNNNIDKPIERTVNKGVK